MVLPPFGCSHAITPSCKTALQYGDDAAMTSRKGFTTVDTYQRYMANKLRFLIKNTSNLAT